MSREMADLFERIPALKPAARAMAEERLEKLDLERKAHEAQLAAWERRAASLEHEAVDAKSGWPGRLPISTRSGTA